MFKEDANLAYDYADCRNGKSSLIALWESARQQMLDFAKEMGMKTKEIQP